MFNLLDSDEDGVLSSKDLQVLIPNHNEVQQMIGAQDIDMDGSINYLEFAFLMNSWYSIISETSVLQWITTINIKDNLIYVILFS